MYIGVTLLDCSEKYLQINESIRSLASYVAKIMKHVARRCQEKYIISRKNSIEFFKLFEDNKKKYFIFYLTNIYIYHRNRILRKNSFLKEFFLKFFLIE